MRENIHVVFKDNEWKIKEENSDNYLKSFSRKEDAIEFAKKEAQNNKSELFIHNKNNTIIDRNSYGNDNYPPKG